MVPSSLTISEITPAGSSPASRARSTAASVWPGRTSTPPSAYRSGKTCPGCTNSNASVAESIRVRTVCERSAAEMPVVTPSRASTETVYAVRIRSRLCGVISGMPSRSSVGAVIGAQITPEE